MGGGEVTQSVKTLGIFLMLTAPSAAAPAPPAVHSFVVAQCSGCHNATLKRGNLDLVHLPFVPAERDNFAIWTKVHDRVRDGEMPPVRSASLTRAAREAFLESLSPPLIAADRTRYAASGRSVMRRLNRQEYENTLRDLLGAPWLQIQDMLPEDGVAYKFNKSGEALDVSHVHMNQYLAAADYALREVLPQTQSKPVPVTQRFYSRDMNSFFGQIRFPSNERDVYPVVGNTADVEELHRTGRRKPGDPKSPTREIEGMAVVCSSYEPIELHFNKFTAPVSGRYKLRLYANTVWVGPTKGEKWWKPDPENISAGRTDEPITVYSERPPRQQRWLGRFDVHPQAQTNELDVYLLKGETIRVDAARFFRSRPVTGGWHNPLATKDGQPGVSFRWLEAEGPIVDQWPSAGPTLMFGNLPYSAGDKGGAVYQSNSPAVDARRLLAAFLKRAYRRPVPEGELERFAKVADKAMASGYSFTDAMISAYSAVLVSPSFITLEEQPRPPGQLRPGIAAVVFPLEHGAGRRAEATRHLQSPAGPRSAAGADRTPARGRAGRSASCATFLDYWLDLRKLNNTSPDENLYPDYYLDDYLVESAGDETRAFFTAMLESNLPARNVVASDFAMLNERLADLYGIPGVHGSALRRVALPADSVRGGLLTQASVLKVTANGTTTSPVLRGVWINERILGRLVPPPPSGVPPVEPDVRGTKTIRDQLAQHRSQTFCKSCHARIDPPGFALESFDVAGGDREKYRAVGGEGKPAEGVGKNGHLFEFRYALPVDPSGTLPDGRSFANVRELKNLLLTDERQIARNLASQLVVYATGSPVRFGDRPQLEAILDRARNSGYGTADLIDAVIQSELFRSK